MTRNTIRKAAVASFMAAACLMPLAACGGADTSTGASPVVVDNGQTYKLIDHVGQLPQKPVTDDVTYFAYQAEQGTYNFGPGEALASAKDGAEKFVGRLVADPLLLATVIAFDQFGEGLDPAVVHTQADGYAVNKANRVADTQMFINNVAPGGVQLIDMGTTRYDSLGMIPGANRNVRPTLTKFSEQPEMHQTLVLTMKSGKKIFLRVACGFQPSVPKFTKVTPPPVKEKPANPVLCPEGTKFAGKPIPKDGACDIPPTKPETTPPTSGTTTPPTTPPPTTTTPPPVTTTTTPPPTTTTTPPPTTTTPPPVTTTSVVHKDPGDRPTPPPGGGGTAPSAAPTPSSPDVPKPTEATPTPAAPPKRCPDGSVVAQDAQCPTKAPTTTAAPTTTQSPTSATPTTVNPTDQPDGTTVEAPK